jgi:hypothetical protein
MRNWLEAKVLPGEVAAFLAGYEDVVSVSVANLITETELFLESA